MSARITRDRILGGFGEPGRSLEGGQPNGLIEAFNRLSPGVSESQAVIGGIFR
jgi:hypothetical protein